MKRNLLFFVLTSLIISLSSCEKEDDDPCADKVMPEINGQFILKLKATYNDGVPFEGNAHLSIFKKYCGGHVSGEFDEYGSTNSTGYWNPGMQYFYKFENLDDKVTVAWYIDGPNGYERVLFEEFYYADVSGANYYIDKTYNITLPWSS